MAAVDNSIHYPRRVGIRAFMRGLIKVAYSIIMDIEVVGQENLPATGPLIIIANHFHFIDPVTLIGYLPYPMEFIGGYRTPNAPGWTEIFRILYGVLLVRRGSSSRESMQAALSILKQNGTLAIFPEGGSWATVLRPPRPGTALLAARSGAKILPVGLDGANDVFPALFKGRRAKVRVVFGIPYFASSFDDGNLTVREQMDEMGHEMMRHIKDLIPPERHGWYSDDPVVKEAARGTEIYPWDGIVEE